MGGAEASPSTHILPCVLPGKSQGLSLFSNVVSADALGLSVRVSKFQKVSKKRKHKCCRYIERPLLVAGRKFHIRAYVLCVGSLSVYAFSEALALFAGEPYKGCAMARIVCASVVMIEQELFCDLGWMYKGLHSEASC